MPLENDTPPKTKEKEKNPKQPNSFRMRSRTGGY